MSQSSLARTGPKVLCLAAALILGTGAVSAVYAATTTAGTEIQGCYNKNGALRVLAPGASCDQKKETPISWNSQGVQGLPGIKGETGATGAIGPAGANGAQGIQGLTGLTGEQGIQGEKGETGPAGKDGAAGAQGPAGPAGGTAVVDPSQNNLTYRMKIGADPAVQITGFTQKITQSGTTQTGVGGGAGKASVGDVIATLPMNSRIVTQLAALAKGSHVPTATVEMCKPGEVTGRCTLELSLTEVMVVGIDVRQDPTQATATVQLNFGQEKVSILPGSPQAVTSEWNIVENTPGPPIGSTLATSAGDTTYTTTLTGQAPLGVLSTRSWHQGFTQSGTTHLGAGGGDGKASFSNIVAETRTGPGTIALLRAMTTGEILPTVEIAGCEASTCASKTVLSDVIVTELVLGSPALFDQVQFTYGAIKWDRNDDVTEPHQNRSFFWDIATNTAG